MQLAKETQQKVEEAEQQCQDLTKSSFGECQPCLEDSCKAFYTSTCRRGFASFSFKVWLQHIPTKGISLGLMFKVQTYLCESLSLPSGRGVFQENGH